MFGLTHHENQGPGGKFGGHQRKSKSRTTEEFPCCGRRDGRAPSDRAAGFARTPLLFTKWVWGKAQRLVPPATPASLSLVITVSISTLEQSRLSEYLHQGLFSFRWLEIKVRSKTPKTLPNPPPRKPVRKSGSYTTGSVSASSCQLRLHTEHVLLYLRLFPFFFLVWKNHMLLCFQKTSFCWWPWGETVEFACIPSGCRFCFQENRQCAGSREGKAAPFLPLNDSPGARLSCAGDTPSLGELREPSPPGAGLGDLCFCLVCDHLWTPSSGRNSAPEHVCLQWWPLETWLCSGACLMCP